MNQFLSFQIASWIIVLKSLKSHKLLSRTLSYKNIFSLLHATLEFKLTYWLKMVRWLKTANKKAIISAFRWNCSYSIFRLTTNGSAKKCDLANVRPSNVKINIPDKCRKRNFLTTDAPSNISQRRQTLEATNVESVPWSWQIRWW